MKNGRKLATAQKSGYTISYEYNADGLRTEKTINGKTTKYYYEGSKLLGEQKEGVNLYYFYDNSGQIMGLRYNDVNYYPLRNLQGDVVALTDYNGNKVVEYVYDSWGKVESVTGSLASTLGKDNPIRYRGYYYDEETGLYYLQSRYYDPATCRFVNADGYASTGQGIIGNNMFAYCGNNPVNRLNLHGNFLYSYDSRYCSMENWDGICSIVNNRRSDICCGGYTCKETAVFSIIPYPKNRYKTKYRQQS